MSQKENFQDNFKRDSEEDMLDYDDSAFFYFSLAILTFMLMPYWYYTLKAVYASKFNLDK
jgi:hypothetical protein